MSFLPASPFQASALPMIDLSRQPKLVLSCCMAAVVAALPMPAHGDPVAAGRDSTPTDVAEFELPSDQHIVGRVTQRFEMYNPRSAEQLEHLKELGFTQVILDWPDLHPQATAAGLNVVLANWWSAKTSPEEVEKAIELAKQVDRRRLVGISMMDEPERYAPDTPFSFYRGLYENLRDLLDRELPGVQLEISHWGPLPSWTDVFYHAFVPLYQATDRIRLMPYPDLNEGPLAEVYYQMLRSRQLMRLADRELPQTVILQTWVIPEEPKLPTIPELRVMAYTAILAGADTLSFFNYDLEAWAKTPGFTDGFENLMAELTAFAENFADAEVRSQMSATGVLKANLEKPGQSAVTVTVNTNRESVDGLDPLAVQVEYEERPVWTPSMRPCVPRPRPPLRCRLRLFRGR